MRPLSRPRGTAGARRAGIGLFLGFRMRRSDSTASFFFPAGSSIVFAPLLISNTPNRHRGFRDCAREERKKKTRESDTLSRRFSFFVACSTVGVASSFFRPFLSHAFFSRGFSMIICPTSPSTLGTNEGGSVTARERRENKNRGRASEKRGRATRICKGFRARKKPRATAEDLERARSMPYFPPIPFTSVLLLLFIYFLPPNPDLKPRSQTRLAH